MKTGDFTTETINTTIDRALAGKELDFCQVIVDSVKKRLSVIGQYNAEASYVTLDENLAPVKYTGHEAYYGVSPQINNEVMIKAISNLELSNPDKLDAFVKANAGWFFLHEGQEKYLRDFARYLVIAMSVNFCISILIDEDMNDAFLLFAKDKPYITVKDGLVTIKGCPDDETICFLSDFRFCKQQDNTWRISSDGISIEEAYRHTETIVLTNGSVFYSGTLLKVMGISRIKNRYENFDTECACLHFERSSYVTVFALDNDLTNHPLLSRCNTLHALFEEDDACKSEMIRRLKGAELQAAEDHFDKTLEIVNEYLGKCFNVNQIGVSSVLLTSDSYMIFGKRTSNSIDADKLYPSVNGNAEISDANVSFYKYSVFEDVPSIVLDGLRIDFLEEVCRECYAELKIPMAKQELHCLGLILSGNGPKQAGSGRRCHFNILYEYEATQELQEVQDGSKNANESFENKQLLGFRISSYQNAFSFLAEKSMAFFRWLVNNKDLLESCAMLVAAIGLLVVSRHLEENSASYFMSLGIAFFIILAKLISWVPSFVGWMKGLKTRKHKTVFLSKPDTVLEKKINSFFENKGFHPATYAITILHIKKKLYEKFKSL